MIITWLLTLKQEERPGQKSLPLLRSSGLLTSRSVLTITLAAILPFSLWIISASLQWKRDFPGWVPWQCISSKMAYKQQQRADMTVPIFAELYIFLHIFTTSLSS